MRKEVDKRSVCKDGYGGTSTIDVLLFYRRRPDVDTEIVEFDEWMTNKPWKKEAVDHTGGNNSLSPIARI